MTPSSLTGGSDGEGAADNPVVGHKTFYENGRYWHEPLRQNEADEMLAHVEAERVRREEAMPDEQSAIRQLWDAQYRLKDFGWEDPVYAPKDGSPLEIIELGSTGIHRGYYEGKWPDGHWWVVDDDHYPSRPALARAATPTPTEGEQS